jgi:hypothetical protein
MESRLAATGIRFNDYFFSEPINLAAWTPPKCAGLFIILMNDPNWAPKAFQPLYFGEFGNNAPISAVLQDCGRMVAAVPGKTMYVTVLEMPFSTTRQRLGLRDELIRAYNPPFQGDANSQQPHDLAVKLAELEKQHMEQMAQMMQLRASMNVNPDPASTPRRRIGFVTN